MIAVKNVVTFASLCLLVGCSGNGKFSMAKRAPDEFMVISNPPLYIPPNFDLNDPSKLEVETKVQKEPMQPSEKQFLEQIYDDKTKVEPLEEDAPKGIARTFFSRFKGKKSAEVIDPFSEKERIKENQLHGKPINEGTVKTRKEGGSTIDKLLGNSAEE